jgi:peroxiredoxin family protein/TusA-related sulfurtransferase
VKYPTTRSGNTSPRFRRISCRYLLRRRLRGYIAERILRQNGFENVRNLSGGFKTYSIVTQKQSNEDIFDSECIGMDDTIYQTENQASCPAPREGNASVKSIEVDACGLQCPGPILKLKEEIDKILPGERLKETATDPGFGRDVRSWCNMTGNRLVELEEKGGKVIALIEKNAPKKAIQASIERPLGTTIVVFSQDMDRALASFVIANGAASTGQKVTMFFTFWGLNVIKRQRKPRVRKDFMGRMFGFMLPSDSSKLSLSKLNMGGLGSKMMKARMKAKNVDSLEKMIATAQAAGIRLVGCQMSMDIMGVAKEELIDGVEIGGVAAFLEASSEGHASLFI